MGGSRNAETDAGARYAFGDFVLDCGTRQVLRAGVALPFSPKALLLLELLIRCRPQAVSRTRLTAALWADTHVGPTSLHVLVSQVRAALGDDPDSPRWIRTVPRFGYAFAGPAAGGVAAAPEAGPASAAEGRARILIAGGEGQRDREVALGEGEHVIGRDAGLAVTLDSPGVSRRHARIVVRGEEARLEDLGSKNGTFVGEERLAAAHLLEEGDVVHLGRHQRLVFTRRDPRRTVTDLP
jgi:DNA-binding winged helix-turn-helix (wHTH) protein